MTATPVTSKLQAFMAGPSLWERLVAPSPRLKSVSDKRNARLLASLLVVAIPLLAAALVGSDIAGTVNMARDAALRLSLTRWGMFVFVLAAYGLSRTSHYAFGSGLTVFILWAIMYASMIQNPDTPYGYGAQILIQTLPILITSMLFPMRGVVVTFILIEISILASPLLLPQRTLVNMVLPFVILSLMSGVIVVSMRHRDLIERDRRSELLKANSELGRALVGAEKARHEAEEADRLKSEFLATMSHELRTPLHAIIGYADVQLAGIAGDMTKTQNEYQERILANASHLLEMINDVLDLSKIEAGRMELALRPFNLKAWAEEIERQVAGLAVEKKIDFKMNVDASLPAQIVADAGRVRQIALNLISNAIKFTERGSVTVDLLRQSPDAWTIKVADTGVGIPAHALEFIFEEFRQVDGTSTRQHGGTGLGLAIVRKLSRLMGGTVGVQSEAGKGSLFTAQLPLVEVSQQPVLAQPVIGADHVLS